MLAISCNSQNGCIIHPTHKHTTQHAVDVLYDLAVGKQFDLHKPTVPASTGLLGSPGDVLLTIVMVYVSPLVNPIRL